MIRALAQMLANKAQMLANKARTSMITGNCKFLQIFAPENAQTMHNTHVCTCLILSAHVL